MRLPKDIFENYTKPRVFLCHPDKERICQLDVTELKGSFKLNSYSEITFEVARHYNDLMTGELKVNPYYDMIEALRLIYIEDFGYFELQGTDLTSDGIQEYKACTAYSLEYTLSQKYIEDFYANTGETDSIEVIYAANQGDEDSIIPVVLYNTENTDLSLLHLILEKDYAGWTIGHVDTSLQKLSRTFEIDRQSIYDFLISEVCEKFNCYIVFDTEDMTINVYAESLTAKCIVQSESNTFTLSPQLSEITVVSVDGYKITGWTYDASTGVITLDEKPVIGAHIEAVGRSTEAWETDVFITFDNLSRDIKLNYDADAIKTVLSVTFGEGESIREVNLGLPYITDLSYFHNVEWMGQDLYDAYNEYLLANSEAQTTYAANSEKMQELAAQIDFIGHRLSLEYSVAQHVNADTVGSYYVRSGTAPNYYYKEVSLPSEYNAGTTYYSTTTQNLNAEKVDRLYKALISFCARKSTWETELTDLSEDFKFMSSEFNSFVKSLKSISPVVIPSEDFEYAFYPFMEAMWNELGMNPLKDYMTVYYGLQQTEAEAGHSKKDSDDYSRYYMAYLINSSAEAANFGRGLEISKLEEEYKTYQSENLRITNGLSMDQHFTKDQLAHLNAFLREDELQIDDILITSQDSLADTFKAQKDALETARIELQKICQPKLNFTMTMANIYAIPEFEPITHQFQLGNVIKIGLRPGCIKQSRILQVDINFEDFSDFSCEFGELTSLRNQSDIHADLLSKAVQAGKSVATNASYWTRGSDQANSTDLKIQQGLLDATTQIKAIDGTQGVTIDKYGIKLQKINSETGEADPHQTWMTNNMILMSDDGFKTSRAAIGQLTVEGHEYYGLIAEMMIAGYIEGSKIVGGSINIGNGTFVVDELGNVIMNAASIAGYATTGQTTHYGTCTTASTSQVKHVTCPDFQLYQGASITVKFSYANSAAGAQLNVNNTGAKNIAAEDWNVMSSDSAYNWTDNSTVSFVYDGDFWRIADSNAIQRTNTLSTRITQTESDIKAVAEANDEVTERVASLEITADSITSEIQSASKQSTFYGTCGTAATTVEKVVVCSEFTSNYLKKGISITVKFTNKNNVDKPTLNVNNTGAKYIAIDGVYLYANSAAGWSDGSVVNLVYNGSYWEIVDSGALSQIKQTADEIALKVSKDELGSEIKINKDAVVMAWNQSNDYIVFESGEINMYTSSTHSTNTLFAKYNNSGAWYYRDGTDIGRIGTNKYTNDDAYKGLVFDLEDTANYMCWAARDSSTDNSYDVKLKYHHKDSTKTKEQKGLHFYCDTYANGKLYLTDKYKWIRFSAEDPSGLRPRVGYCGPMMWCKHNTDDDTYEKFFKVEGYGKTIEIFGGSSFYISNNVAVDIWSDIDMHTWSINNVKVNTASDARLKKNISDAQVDAITALNQIELKEFDWIETDEHEELGMIAQQLRTVLPHLVHENTTTGQLSINMIGLIPYLVKSIQELTEYVTGGISAFNSRNEWTDSYTAAEKAEFVSSNPRILQVNDEPLKEDKLEPVSIPIDTQGEQGK